MSDKQAIERCGATKKNGQPCGNAAGWGTGHVGVGTCRKHLGATQNHELAGQVELARRRVGENFSARMPIGIHDAIVWCVETAAMQKYEAALEVAKLDSLFVDGRPHPVVRFYQECDDRLLATAAVAAKANVDERRVLLAEQHGERIAKVIRAVLLERGVDPDAPETRESVRRHLTLVAGDGPAQG